MPGAAIFINLILSRRNAVYGFSWVRT